MPHPIIFNGSLGLGLMIVGLGLNATLRPNDHLQRLEFPIPTEPLAKKFSLALMRIWGIRNITVGVLISIIWTTGDENLMAKALSAALAMPVTDGFVSRIIIGGGETQHWVFPPLLVVMIAGLFGYF
ncbi:integral membrane protein [Fusarium globosum]|uniref:Integral membrane protein n=1 Tax=Fusarium globosum TaxID=78864 RepID=A0A8H5XUG6_9HYPO|nr:integral membrane protein [Fusarium globosum]